MTNYQGIPIGPSLTTIVPNEKNNILNNQSPSTTIPNDQSLIIFLNSQSLITTASNSQ